MIVLLFLAIFSFYVAFRGERKGILTVAFLNIGQGDAIFIEAPSGNQILIDGGPGKSILRELSKVMPFYDRSVDVVLATHADQDHVGGLPDAFKKYKVSLFLETGVAGPSSSYEELEKIVNNDKADIKKIIAKRGMMVDLGDGAVLQIFFPDRDPSGMETNTSSIVTRLVYGENEFLLTGDSPKAIEQYLVSLGSQGRSLTDAPKGTPLTLQSDVLKAGHHGSKTSSSDNFVRAVNPEYVVISAGKDNRYGHPHQEVVDLFNKLNIKILRTDTEGRIVFKSDGVDLEVK